MASLKAEGLDENTLVIFVGDNGTGGQGKGTVTELGARVPCIVRGPGVKRGVVSRAVADLRISCPRSPNSHRQHCQRMCRSTVTAWGQYCV